MLNIVLQYVRDAKEKLAVRQADRRAYFCSVRVQRLSAVIGREIVLARKEISFHPEDGSLINSVSHIQWKFLEKITPVA
jgi:hypothetical protein